MMSSLFGLTVKKSSAFQIKFCHEVDKKSIHFLDLDVWLSDGQISTDLYVKPAGRHQFFHYTLSHPDHTKRSIVFSQVLRVRMIFSEKFDFFKHLEKMKSWFLVRGYSKDLIKAEMKKIIFTSKSRYAKRETNHWRRFHLLWLITLNLSQWINLFLNIKTFFVWTMKLKGCLPLNPRFHSEVQES